MIPLYNGLTDTGKNICQKTQFNKNTFSQYCGVLLVEVVLWILERVPIAVLV